MQPAAMPTTMEMTIWKNFITMPTTAIGICAYCSCENISSSAPYLRSMLLMAAIAASRATGEVVIHDAEAVNKSYPDFFDHYRLLGGKVTLEEE